MKITAIVLMLLFGSYWAVASSEYGRWKSEASREWTYQSFDLNTGKYLGPQRTTKYDAWKCHNCHERSKIRMGGLVSPQAGAVFVDDVMIPINLSVRSK